MGAICSKVCWPGAWLFQVVLGDMSACLVVLLCVDSVRLGIRYWRWLSNNSDVVPTSRLKEYLYSVVMNRNALVSMYMRSTCVAKCCFDMLWDVGIYTELMKICIMRVG